jgi:hypothetical protein
MTVREIRDIARNQGIKTGKLRKAELIKVIQRQEGNFDCFGTAGQGACDQHGCLWRDDCFKEAQIPLA